jgi:hypothetical protein
VSGLVVRKVTPALDMLIEAIASLDDEPELRLEKPSPPGDAI